MHAVAPYAVRAERSRGRLHPEPEAEGRSPWQRDRDRVIHSSAFRALQYKTQVFVNHEGDYYRTRLTHSIEVAQIARSIARELRLDEDLTEALALAHDLGHTPFGHAGEDALNAAMLPFGGFDHNGQSLKVVTKLEQRYAAFDGLNLTWETLEGLAKHNGPVRQPSGTIAAYDAVHALELSSWAGGEAQVAAICDDVAYHSHDLDDGLRAGLFTVADIEHLPVVGPALREARRASLDLAPERLRHETIRRVINELARDLIEESRRRLAALAPGDADAIRAAAGPVIGFSPGDGRCEPGDQAIPACPDVSTLAGQSHDGEGAPGDGGAVHAAAWRYVAVAGRLAKHGGVGGWPRRRDGAGHVGGAGGERLHRGHDGPVCAG